ncbi:MAG: rhomboid family intramembrane serine protease [Oscillospiraceae bacterium]|nr:rhomboid family intramembrane serine protease [Oscillospiraceae bacterium]MDE6901060.1 rhomboid family intramembrane serine protease [Oscillospiraceae bacterium]
MRKLNDAIDRFCALHPRLGISGLMRYIVIANALIYVVSIFDKSGLLLSALAMSPEAVLHGQVWRLVTYVLIPTNGGFWLVVSLMFYYWLGDALERLWGSAKFTIYYLSGTLLSALAALLVYAIDRQPIALFGASYVNTALFMAYALTYPDAMVRIYFILPIKMKWLAVLEGALYVIQILQHLAARQWGMALMPVIAMLNLFVFFSPDFSRRVDRFQARHRSEAVQFRKAVKEQKRQKGYNHKCEVCGRTDTDFPDLQFRYCSKCTGYHCFCEEHIFNHTHHIE